MQSYSEMAANLGRTTDTQDPAEKQFLAWFESVSGAKAPDPIEEPDEETALSAEEQFLRWFESIQGTPAPYDLVPEPPDPREAPATATLSPEALKAVLDDLADKARDAFTDRQADTAFRVRNGDAII